LYFTKKSKCAIEGERVMDIVERLREHNEPPFDYIAHEAANKIVQLREALLDIASFVPRAEAVWLKKATIDTLRGIPNEFELEEKEKE
jgi:hypothetical protein